MAKLKFTYCGILLCMVLSSVEILAQNGTLTNAILYYQDGDLLKAQGEIDAAVKHEKTITSAKAWYYRGVIYKTLSDKSDLSTRFPEAADTATASFLKAKSLDKPTGEYYKMSEQGLQEQWVKSTNEGVKHYQAGSYAQAFQAFQLAHQANPSDTTALLYGSYAATAAKDPVLACALCQKLREQGYTKSYTYKTCADYYLSIEKPAQAQEELKQGMLKNSTDISLVQELANLYITTNQNEAAITVLSVLEKAKPEDPLVLTNIAVQYQKMNQLDKAEAYYLKALEKDNNNYIALFNLAGLYIDKGRVKMNKYNSLTNEQFKKEGGPLKTELTNLYTKALEYCKKASPLADNEEDKNKLGLMMNDLESVLKTLNK